MQKNKGEDAMTEETEKSAMIADYNAYVEFKAIGFTDKQAASHLSRSEEQLQELILQFQPKTNKDE